MQFSISMMKLMNKSAPNPVPAPTAIAYLIKIMAAQGCKRSSRLEPCTHIELLHFSYKAFCLHEITYIPHKKPYRRI